MAILENDGRSVPDLYIELCRTHLSHGKRVEAVASLEKGLSVFPNDIQLLTEYGRLLGEERRGSEILHRLENAVLDLAKPMEIFKLLASIYKSVGERDGAVAAYRVFLGYAAFETLLKDWFMAPGREPGGRETPVAEMFPEAIKRKVRIERKKRAIASLSLLQERMAKGSYH